MRASRRSAPRRPWSSSSSTANLTDFNSKLEVRGPKDAISGPLVANGNASLLTQLPTGIYRVSAADIPSAKPVRFVVGPYRTSSRTMCFCRNSEVLDAPVRLPAPSPSLG